MATITVVEYEGIAVENGIVTHLPRGELRTTDVNTAQASSIKVTGQTGFVVLSTANETQRFSQRAAIGSGNPGAVLHTGAPYPVVTAPGSTIFFTPG